MLRAALRRFGPSARPTPSRPLARLLVRPAVELLESRDTPSGGGSGGYPGYPPPTSPPPPPSYPPPGYPGNSPVVIRAPYAPQANPVVVADILSDPDHAQALSYDFDTSALGDSVTAWTYLPVPFDTQRPEYGLYVNTMSRTGVAGSKTKLEGFDWDKSDLFTSGLDGPVAVGVAPGGGFAIAYLRSTAHYLTPTDQYPDWTSDALYVRTFTAGGAAQGGPVLIDQMVDADPMDERHYSLKEPKVATTDAGGLAVAYLRRTDLDPTSQAHGSTEIDLMAGGGGSNTAVAHSFLDRGNGSFSQYAGDLIVSPDLATNGVGGSVVVWARLIKPDVYYYSGYLQLDAVYAQRFGAVGGGDVHGQPERRHLHGHPDPPGGHK